LDDIDLELSMRLPARHSLFVASLLLLGLLLSTEGVWAQTLPAGEADALARLNGSPRHGECITVPAGDGDQVRAWIVYPQTAERAPVVVVIHEIFGLTDWIRAVTDQLAAEGFIAIAPDLLSGKGPGGGGSESVDQQGATALIRSVSTAEANRRIRAVAMYGTGLLAATGQVGSIGFCWGGSASFNLAVDWADLDASVVYYGTSPANEEVARVTTPVLGLYGGNDARVNTTIEPARDVLAANNRRFETEIYEGAGHGVLRQQDGQSGANLRATQAAWPRTVGFLRELLVAP
jgi:carboxymethylenebutenolidase